MEIERKFLIDKSKIDLNKLNCNQIEQGYLENNIQIKLENKNIIFIKNNHIFKIKIIEEDFNDLKNIFFYKNNEFVFENFNTIRIRTEIHSNNIKLGYLTIKGKTIGVTRVEIEYLIDFDIAQKILKFLCNKKINKNRYILNLKNHIWEIDVFKDKNEGLIVAEIELENESDFFEKPDFILDEVSLDSKYYNVNLIKNPFKKWK